MHATPFFSVLLTSFVARVIEAPSASGSQRMARASKLRLFFSFYAPLSYFSIAYFSTKVGMAYSSLTIAALENSSTGDAEEFSPAL